MNEQEILSDLKKTGIAEHDAKVLADCVVTRKSCSWVNTDPVEKEAVRSLLELIKDKDYRIDISIKAHRDVRAWIDGYLISRWVDGGNYRLGAQQLSRDKA